jgi:hypothetical protein
VDDCHARCNIEGNAHDRTNASQIKSDTANFASCASESLDYSNHLHTISWAVYDNAGHGTGIGSRWIDLGPMASLTNTSDPSIAPDFIASDSYTLTVSGGAVRANQAVTVTTTLNGVGQGTTSMGTTDGNGNFTMSGSKNNVGDWTEQWYVGGVAASPLLTYQVAAAPAGYTASTSFPSIPGSFTAPSPALLCDNIAGTWEDADEFGNSVLWKLSQSGTSISGTLSFEAYLGTTDCGMVTYNTVMGSYDGTTFPLTASDPSPSTACGYNVASSFTDRVTVSGGASCSLGSGSYSNPIWPATITTALPHHASTSQRPRQQQGTSTWTAKSPRFSVQYAAYIPVDHVPGPQGCHSFGQQRPIPNTLLYLGDAFRGTYRTSQSLLVTPDAATSSNFVAATGETRNYGYGSPANGSNLDANLVGGFWVGADEDGVPGDCILWNARGQAPTDTMQGHGTTYLTNTKAQINLYGNGSDPLEPPGPSIKWNMTTVIDDTNPDQPTAQVTYTHSCYPAHQIKVNGTVVYNYPPPRNDTLYLGLCLSNILPQISGTNFIVSVPAH